MDELTLQAIKDASTKKLNQRLQLNTTNIYNFVYMVERYTYKIKHLLDESNNIQTELLIRSKKG